MDKLRIIVANEPRSYRDSISGALQILRPIAEVFRAEPADLEREVARLAPHLVICSRLTPTVESGAPCWLELYPGGSPDVTVGINGERTDMPEFDFEGLLAVVDRVEILQGSER
ncbi:MAG TPA: hypothetical protein VKA73_10300 [Rubrobacter sp.]|nr:hypothetical protein [Rubrobacter sp.]